MTLALVPVKQLDAAKSRLAGALPRRAIAALSLAMLGDVLEALAGVSQVHRRVVVTPDAEVGRAATAAGAEALVRSDSGLNASLDEATTVLAPRGVERLLVVLGDVAGATPKDLSRLFEVQARLGRPAVVLAPLEDGGTATLLRAPHDAIPSCFGADSLRAHREAARTRRVSCEVCPLPSLAIDLDRPEDLRALLRSTGAAPRTRALLAELGFEEGEPA